MEFEIAEGNFLNLSQPAFLEVRIQQWKERFAKKILVGRERTRTNELNLM